jgi:YD repeat-containing protein
MHAHSVVGYLRSRGWFFLLCAVLGLWIAWRLSPPRDYAKWQARVKVELAPPISQEAGRSGLAPCFFFLPYKADRQQMASSYIGDCLPLLPTGNKIDALEIALGGGLFPIKTDLYVPDTMPLAFTRTYIPPTDWCRRFQVYLPHVYDLFLSGSRFPYTYLDWRLPDGRSIHYERISSGTDYVDAIYGPSFNSGTFSNSRVNWNGFGWDWTLANGSTYLSPEAYAATRPQQGSLVGIFDRNGHEVRLSRGASGELAEIRSPAGRWIRFEYSQLHLIRARDSSGDVVDYEYDSDDRLSAVRHAGGETDIYSYDAADRIIKVEDAEESMTLEITYDPSGKVAALKTDREHAYTFRYVAGNDGKTTNVSITDPGGKVIRVDIYNEGSGISYGIQRSTDAP